jgi:hypothetical protein
MSNSAVQLDGKSQYLGRRESTAGSEVYNWGVYNNGIYNFPVNLEIANEWTLGFWVKPKPFKEFGTIFSVGEIDKENTIIISTTPVSSTATSLSELRVLIKGGDGTIIKHYGWGGWFQTDTWTHTFLQWDGTDLTANRDAIVSTTGVALTDASGTMGDSPPRKIFYGTTAAGELASFSGTVGHFGMWNSLLDPAEFVTVVSGGFGADLTTSSGSYVSQDSLQHYWKPGEDLGNIGKDFVTSGTALDLDKGRGITTDDIVTDGP